jgi:hypothetical protein
MLFGNGVFITIRQLTSGTSDATTATLSLPFTAATITNMVWLFPAQFTDNGITSATYGRGTIASGGNTIVFGVNAAADGGFTNSGNKRIGACSGFYEKA